jgi:urease accessory protein
MERNRMRRARGTISFGVAMWLAVASPAHAHLVNSGLGPFYDGLAHPLVTPEDLLPVVALALLAGLGGAQYGRWALFVLPVAWLVGMAVAPITGAPFNPSWVSAVLTVLLGILVATDRIIPLALVIGLAMCLGIMHGFWSGPELVGANGRILMMAGIGCALFVVVSLLSGQVAALRAQFARIIVRVAGSWIAASGLLMFGWAMR